MTHEETTLELWLVREKLADTTLELWQYRRVEAQQNILRLAHELNQLKGKHHGNQHS